MTSAFALFRVAAGPRIGHGHLRRAETIARALARPSVISVRGAGASTNLRRVGATLAEVTRATSPSVVIVDDPVAREAEPWCRAWRRRGVPVVSVHDLGLAPVRSTLAVNGSIDSAIARWPADAVLTGLRYAVVRAPRPGPQRMVVRRVLVSLGGGPRRAVSLAIAHAIVRQLPDVTVIVPQGHGVQAGSADGRVECVAAPRGLAPWLARVDVAVLAGGVSLYEAMAAGVPTVALAVVPAQVPTIAGFAARRLVVDAGLLARHSRLRVAGEVAGIVRRLADDTRWRRRVWRQGPRTVDGQGAARVARAIVAMVEGDQYA